MSLTKVTIYVFFFIKSLPKNDQLWRKQGDNVVIGLDE